MTRFRKRPVVIDALLYVGEWKPVYDWLCELAGLDEIGIPFGGRPSITRDPETRQLRIETLEGTMLADPGDYVIRGVRGELYPCKPDIFRQTYEEVA